MSKHNKASNKETWAERMAKSARVRGVFLHDGMGTLAPEIRTFFDEPIQLSPGPAPFEGYTPEELDRLFAEIAAEPCFAASTDKTGC